MKKNYFLTLILTLCFGALSFAQTTLAAGDVVVIELRADSPDTFRFVPLVDLETNTVIKFTENGWDGSALRTNESTITFTADAPISAGTNIEFAAGTSDTRFSVSGSLGFSASGDQVLVYQGDAASPTFIFAVQSNSTAWQSGSTGTTNSDLPSGLTDGTNAVAAGQGSGAGDEWDNVYYNGTTSGTKSALLASVANVANWVGNNGTSYTPISANFTVTPDTSDPTVLTAGSVGSLDYFENNGPSADDSFTVSGTNLTADITVTAPTNFEVSLTSGSGFGNSVMITQSGGTVSSTPVYVRLAAGLTANTYNGDVTVSSTGATDKTVAVTGIVSPDDPQFSYTAFLNDMNYVISVGGPSAEQDFTVQGLFLTTDLVVTAPASFEVSLTSGSGFASSVNITPSSGTVAVTTVYVRLADGLTAGNYNGDITLSSTGVTNQTIAVNGNAYGAPTNSMVITGVYDGPLSGGTPKGVELYVLTEIPVGDLSLYGVSSVSNGGGSTAGNVEFGFPANGSAIAAGTFIYVSTESPNFTTFFGMAPDYTTGVVAINGDDSIELYESGQIIDVFGDVDTDGTGEVWEYLDGWAYRNSNTGPEGTTFTPGNWSYSGVDALEGESDNGSATTPFPIGTYQNTTASLRDSAIEGFAAYPNPVNNKRFTITTNSISEKTVKIFNVLGRQVFATKFSSNNKLVDVASLSTGVYILKVQEGSKIATKKLVVR